MVKTNLLVFRLDRWMMRNPKKGAERAPATGTSGMHGYARVSTDDQDLSMQIEALKRAGVAEADIYQDKKSGKDMRRGGLQDLLWMMRAGDTLVVWRFDRLSRSLRDLLKLFDEMKCRGIHLKSIHEQLDTSTPMGLLMFQLAGMLAEFERNLIAARTSAGMQTAKARGKRFGPKRKLTAKQVQDIIAELRPRKHERGAVSELARKYRVSIVTLRDRVLESNKGKRLWPAGPRARKR